MKYKSILTLGLSLFSFFGFAQDNFSPEMSMRYIAVTYPNMQRYFPVNYFKGEEYIKSRGIDSFTVVYSHINKKGKERIKPYWNKYVFNSDGQITQKSGARRGRPTDYSYDYLQGEFRKKETVFTRKGKFKERQTMISSFDKSGYSRRVYTVNAKGDTLTKTVLGRTDTTTLTSTDYYYRKGKLQYKWSNEFYPNRRNKRTTVYDKKGKEKYVWDYQCKDEGVEIKKHKDTSTICISTVYGKDSIKTVVHHTVGEKGEMIKMVRRFNKYNRMLYSKRSNGVDNIPLFETENIYENDTVHVKSHSKRYWKGEIQSDNIKEFDSNEDVVSNVTRRYKKGKLYKENRVSYRYDAFGRPSKKMTTDITDGSQKIWYFNYE